MVLLHPLRLSVGSAEAGMSTIGTEYQVVQVDAIGWEHPESGGHFPFHMAGLGGSFVSGSEQTARADAIAYAKTCSESNWPASYSVRRVDITEVWATP
jgi:hypothetical protein